MDRETKKLNVLIHGIGTISYAICREIKKSPLFGNVYYISNRINPYMDAIHIGRDKDIKLCVLREIIKEKKIDFVICFNEIYSKKGLIDYYQNEINIPIIGCKKEFFTLESSKMHGKRFMKLEGIKTPEFNEICDIKDLDVALEKFGLPIVIKNNNLQGGFGVHICNTQKECKDIAKKLLREYKYCIAEEYVEGFEITQQYICCGNKFIPLKPVKDIKKIKLGNNYINTGGLASYTPITLTKEQEIQLDEYNKKIINIFSKKDIDFSSILAFNLMFTKDGIQTLEFNMRPGITEFETTIENLDCDLLEILWKIVNNNLKIEDIKYKDTKTACLVIAHKDYVKQKRGTNKKKIEINKLKINEQNDLSINYGVTQINDKKYVEISKNHRFLSILYSNKENPFQEIYKYLKKLDTKNLLFLKDVEIPK